MKHTCYLILSLLLYSCSSSRETDFNLPDELIKTEWKLIKLYEDDLSSLSANPTLNFLNDSELGGNTGCNSFGGEYVMKNKILTIKNIFSTKMFCEGRMEIENKYLNALKEINKLQIVEDQLILFKDENSVLTFSPVD